MIWACSTFKFILDFYGKIYIIKYRNGSMVLREIDYQGFRNLADSRLEFAEEFNFLIGENGTGKTNLLEAIFFVGLASSFRVREERNLINVNKRFLRVNAETNGKKASVYLDSDKKKMTLQGNEVHRLSDFIGWLGITIMSIEDIWIIRGSPAKRRSFLNWTISKISPSYLADLMEYRKILRQRNKILQSPDEIGDLSLLEIFDEQIMHYGNRIYEEREKNLPALKKNVASISAHFGLDKLDIDYVSTCPGMRIDQSIQSKVRQKELIFGQTIIGPHRDDLLFSVNGRPLKYFASEGEERAVAISLKLAEAEMLHAATADRPILLLDEVAAELDEHKREILLNLLNGQVFYASTHMPQFTKISHHRQLRLFKIRRGEIEVSTAN